MAVFINATPDSAIWGSRLSVPGAEILSNSAHFSSAGTSQFIALQIHPHGTEQTAFFLELFLPEKLDVFLEGILPLLVGTDRKPEARSLFQPGSSGLFGFN